MSPLLSGTSPLLIMPFPLISITPPLGFVAVKGESLDILTAVESPAKSAHITADQTVR